MDEMCPSPVARRLKMKRRSPLASRVWSGCATIDGLNRAADSRAYSPEKRAPINNRRASLSTCPGGIARRTFSK